jgi:hypothetical protein
VKGAFEAGRRIAARDDPARPFTCGHPDRAPRGFVESLASSYDPMTSAFRAGLEQIIRQ